MSEEPTKITIADYAVDDVDVDAVPMKLRKLGFCGVDDSISPQILANICESYPFVEFGVLFRPDKEGEPRYASPKWIDELSKVVKSSNHEMELAAHLCGQRVNDLLQVKKNNSNNNNIDDDDDNEEAIATSTFLSKLPTLGFHRVQINATEVNGVDTSSLSSCVPSLVKVIQDYPELEFILQKNDETRPLWEGVLDFYLSSSSPSLSLSSESSRSNENGTLPKNIVMLVDESKGTGVLASSWPSPPKEYDIGYAGGIGPTNVKNVLEDIMVVARGRDVWIDMESSLRSKDNGDDNGNEQRGDYFDIGKCRQCIEVVCELGLFDHPTS